MARVPGDAGAMLSLALATTTLVLGLIAGCAGIRCYSCNSHYDRNCLDPFNNFTTELVNCGMEGHQMPHLPPKEDGSPLTANICRKTVQLVSEEIRVIRSCGWLPNDPDLKDRDCFTRTGTHQVMVYHCVCTGDACNGAIHSTLEYTVLVGLVSLPLFWRRGL